MTQTLIDLGIDPDHPRTTLLLALGDDDLVTGHVASRLAGHDPDDPIGPQFAKLGTQTLGYAARWFRTLVGDRDSDAETATAVTAVAMGRGPREYTHASCCETRPRSFAHKLTRHWLFEHAEAVRLVSLAESTDMEISDAALELLDVKRVHLDHATTWVERFALAEGGKDFLVSGLVDEFPAAFAFFEEIDREADAVNEGLLPYPHAALMDEWLDLMVPAMQDLGLDEVVPDDLTGPHWHGALDLVPTEGGRRGEHAEVWTEQLWPEISRHHRT